MKIEAFKEIKEILIIVDANLGIVKALMRADYLALNISWGLRMRLKRDIGMFLESLK